MLKEITQYLPFWIGLAIGAGMSAPAFYIIGECTGHARGLREAVQVWRRKTETLSVEDAARRTP